MTPGVLDIALYTFNASDALHTFDNSNACIVIISTSDALYIHGVPDIFPAFDKSNFIPSMYALYFTCLVNISTTQCTRYFSLMHRAHYTMLSKYKRLIYFAYKIREPRDPIREKCSPALNTSPPQQPKKLHHAICSTVNSNIQL